MESEAAVGHDAVEVADQFPLGENRELSKRCICFDEMADRVTVVGGIDLRRIAWPREGSFAGAPEALRVTMHYVSAAHQSAVLASWSSHQFCALVPVLCRGIDIVWRSARVRTKLVVGWKPKLRLPSWLPRSRSRRRRSKLQSVLARMGSLSGNSLQSAFRFASVSPMATR